MITLNVFDAAIFIVCLIVIGYSLRMFVEDMIRTAIEDKKRKEERESLEKFFREHLNWTPSHK